MKLMSGRQYKNDISDVIGILREQKGRGKPLTLEMIKTAVSNLYDRWDHLPHDSKELAKESLIDFEKQYPGITNTDNVNDIIRNLKKRKEHER